MCRRSARLSQVAVQDLADLRAYLKGEVQESARVDYTAPELFEGAEEEGAGAGGDGAPGMALGGELAGRGGPLTLEGVRAEAQKMADRNSMLLCPGGKVFEKVLKVVQDQAARQAAQTKQRKERENLESQRQRERRAKQEMMFQGSDRFNRDRNTDERAPAAGAGGRGRGAAEQLGARPARGGGRAAEDRKRLAKAAKAERTPIIVVPAGYNSCLNMYNAKSFLEKGEYKSWEEAREELEQSSKKKESHASVWRAMGKKDPSQDDVEFVVTDVPPTKKEEWKRVVAVFCNGKAWQFKDFPQSRSGAPNYPTQIFSEMRGAYLRFSHQDVPDFVRKWDIEVLTLDRNNRYKDKGVVAQFWKMLDQFLAVSDRGNQLDYTFGKVGPRA